MENFRDLTDEYHQAVPTPNITLTDEQATAREEILEWARDSNEMFKTLSGYAGTGKTTLLHFIVQDLRKKHFNIAVTATTNKAVKVLMDRVESKHFATIHSVLNIKPKKKGTQEIFEPVDYNKSDITEFDLVIIDECSMISRKLLDIIETQITEGGRTKVLFCGDPAQLQPINESLSQCFSFDPSTLTQIVRHGDVIAHKSKLVRDRPHSVPSNELIQEPEISYISMNESKEMFKGWRDNPDYVRLLAWTNDSVARWNRSMRHADWGRKTEHPFTEGDIVIANSPCVVLINNQEDIQMFNSEEGTVQDVHEEYDHYHLLVKKFGGGFAHVNVMKREFKAEIDKELRGLAAAKSWREFWALKKKFHDIRHCYSLTVHKSQGSTFQNVIVDVRDINKNRDVTNRNQLIYVAMTRAADKVRVLK